MKHLMLATAMVFLSLGAISQAVPMKYAVFFTDKSNSNYSVSDPLAFLSQRAIDRRTNCGAIVSTQDFPVNPWYNDSLRNAGVQVICSSRWMNFSIIHTTDSASLVAVQNLPFVSRVVLVGYGDPKKKSIIVKPKEHPVKGKGKNGLKSAKGIMSYDYGTSYNQIYMLSGDAMHDMGYRGRGVRIAVLDAGFIKVNQMAVFDSLFAENRVLGTWNFIDNNVNVYHTATHGSFVLSLMASNVPGEIIGTAPEASYYLLRTEDSGSEYIVEEYFWVCGAEYADSAGADIINSSLGYTVFDDTLTNHTYADMNGDICPSTVAADLAAVRGILVVNSAGNSGANEWRYLGAPSDADSILAVGSVDYQGLYSTFSSLGPSSDGQVKPDVVSQGQESVVAALDGGVQTGSGTSFSSPIIAGMMACLAQANPEATNMQLIEAVRQSATLYQNPDTLVGYGIPNFSYANLLLAGTPVPKFSQSALINLYPNPFSSEINVQYFSADSQRVTLELRNSDGKIVYRHAYNLRPNGYYIFSIDGNVAVTQGIYVLSVTNERSTISRKVVKK
ncbi:MAG: S8 family serine peptidase [Bacteroidetes bacterium]|nr:S8 family serine peptidase [Bacteroidota bacterium]MBU1718092.1 S8 family serine peptidase [Bacteroidota bacterium]